MSMSFKFTKRLSAAFLAATVVAIGFTGCSKNEDKKETTVPSGQLIQFIEPSSDDEVAVMETSMGTIKLQFFPDQAPKAVENFLTHAKDGYYDNLTFHRIIDTFMIQGGDPKGDGTGGESIWGKSFEDEFSVDLHNFRGAISMANAGANTNGSQFFIVQSKTADENLINQMKQVGINDQGDGFTEESIAKYQEVGGTPHLDYVHTVFGQVFEGMDVVDAIAATNGEGDPIVIKSVKVMKYSEAKSLQSTPPPAVKTPEPAAPQTPADTVGQSDTTVGESK